MPGRQRCLQDLDRTLLITPRALVDPETTISDDSFSADLGIDEWQDWMRWDIAAIELDPTVLGLNDGFESTLPSSNATDIETAPLVVGSTDTNFSFEAVPFEIDESIDSSQFLSTSQMSLDLQRPAWTYSPLTAAEQQRLRNIAMPYGILSQVKLSSDASSPTPTISSQSRSPSPEPKSRTHKDKKRKSLIDDEDVPEAVFQSRKSNHNAIEKRYRTNLNDKISCLQQVIPTLWRRSSTDSKSGDEEDSDHDQTDKNTRQQKGGKAAILTRALEYIQHLESTTQRLGDEVSLLETRVGAFEKLAMSGSSVMNSAPALNGLLILKKETLQSTQADFKQIEHRSKSASAPRSRKDSKKWVGK